MSTTAGQRLPAVLTENVANERLTRRRMVLRLLAGAGAGAAWPLVGTAHPIYELLRSNDAILAEAEKLREATWKPAFLNPQQQETLIAIAESLVPGSAQAQVDRFIDLLLSLDKAENQHKFLESLTALDMEVQKRFGKHFPALDEAQKNELLTAVSTQPQDSDASKTDARMNQPSLYNHFENLKGWVSGAYYSSEAGMRELGWSGEYVFESFPGCAHPEGHH